MILFADQLLSLIYMLFMGWFYAFCIACYQCVFEYIRKHRIGIVFDITIQCILMYIVYRGMYKINYGIFNIYVWAMFLFGIFLYNYYYSILFLSAYEQILRILRTFCKPLVFAKSHISAIIVEHYIRRRNKLCKKRLLKQQRHLRKES